MGNRDGAVAGVLAVAAAVASMAMQLIAESARPDYDNASQLISELGERGTPDGALVSWAGFVPVGLLAIAFGLAACWALRADRRLAWGAALVGLGAGIAYVVSAFARCEPGCPSSGDLAQTIHNTLGGALEYLGAAAGMLVFGLRARRLPAWHIEAWISLLAVPVVLVLAGIIQQDSVADSRGVIQRVLEVVIFGWMVVIGNRLARDGAGVGPAATA